MSHFNQIAKEDHPDAVGVVPSEFCALFPLRNATIVQPDEYTNRLLFNALKCTLCQRLMEAPVYLKCSHRFCRSCIQRYIRSNSQKACPTCYTPLLSKRELRSDDFTIDFIELAFGNIKIPQNNDQQREPEVKKEEESVLKARKRNRKRQDSLEIQELGNQPRKKKCRNMLESEFCTLDLKNSTFISNSSNEERSVYGKNKIIPNVSEDEVKIEHIDNLKGQTGDLYSQELTQSNLSGFQNYLIRQAKDSPATDYGLDYYNDLRFKLGQQIFIKIKLQSHPSKPFTPSLDMSQIQCSVFTKAEVIISLISQDLNLFSEDVNLYAVRQGVLQFIDPQEIFAVLNQRYWPTCRQFTPFDINQANSNFSQEEEDGSSLKSTHDTRLIYFSVEFENENLKRQQVL